MTARFCVADKERCECTFARSSLSTLTWSQLLVSSRGVGRTAETKIHWSSSNIAGITRAGTLNNIQLNNNDTRLFVRCAVTLVGESTPNH